MGTGTTARQMWRKEKGISVLSPLRWCFKCFCGRRKGSYDLNYRFNIPKWESSPAASKTPLPVQPNKVPFINISISLRDLTFHSLMHKAVIIHWYWEFLWPLEAQEHANFMTMEKTRELPVHWIPNYSSRAITLSFPGHLDKNIKQALWTKIAFTFAC